MQHSQDDHKLSVDLQKLNDPNEDDSTTRFLRSLNVDDDYLNERRKYFPRHFDHIEERIKIRLLAQINFDVKSKKININMKKDYLKNIRYSGYSFAS